MFQSNHLATSYSKNNENDDSKIVQYKHIYPLVIKIYIVLLRWIALDVFELGKPKKVKKIDEPTIILVQLTKSIYSYKYLSNVSIHYTIYIWAWLHVAINCLIENFKNQIGMQSGTEFGRNLIMIWYMVILTYIYKRSQIIFEKVGAISIYVTTLLHSGVLIFFVQILWKLISKIIKWNTITVSNVIENRKLGF